ncbi:gamma-glutamyl-gamma-aminobutyrate hydrolase family protein [Massilia sp. W12]|uniref:gamma-glutamyl-gamma-aminobutyrate hydrolase family protein n=1 Tax=Massilia sp. W12 TaxID=3126507 RepID=UPI0030D551B5
MHKPIVLVPACTRQLGAHPYHTVQMKYVNAVLEAADCMPLILPAFGARTDWEAVLAVADGVMLTGAPANVHPSHFGEEVHNPALPLDPQRDATTLPLIRMAIERGLPLFAICRGFQEINVALGGSLHQAVQEVPGMQDHRDDDNAPLEEQYGPAHPVRLVAGGALAAILNHTPEIMVNSLHGQGVNRLAQGLRAEAHAPDGLIEAFSVEGAASFAMAFQWHPEWRATENPVSQKIYAAFGQACRARQAAKLHSAAPDPGQQHSNPS